MTSGRARIVEIAAGLLALALVLPASAQDASAGRSSRTSSIPAEGGPILITPFVGASVQVEHGGTVIHVDPWGRGDYSGAKRADLILVTDTPGDHLDPEMIRRLRKPGAPVILPDRPEDARDEGSRERLLQIEGGIVMDNGDRIVAAGVPVEAVAMYDIIAGDPFHAKGEGNGYIVELGEKRLYFSGVTECTLEMKAVEDVAVAFVPMNLPHRRMPPEEAAECVKIIRPDVVYPYHYRERPIDAFVSALEGEDIEVRVHDWYPQ